MFVVTLSMTAISVICLLLVAFSVAEELNVHTVLQDLRQELRYETLLVLYNSREHCPANLQLQTLEVPHLLLASPTSFYLKQQMNSKLLALVCLGENLDQDEALIQALFVNLQHMRKTPTLLLLQRLMTERLRQIFLDCQQHKMLNVLALSSEDQQLYSYRAFPYFKILQHALGLHRGLYFEDLLNDLGGHGIRTMADYTKPRNVVYRDKASGQRKLAGWVFRLVETFAISLNATLDVNWNEERLFHRAIANLTYANELDLPLCVSDISNYRNALEYTYPVELSTWRLMLPVEAELPSYQLFFKVFEWETGLLIAGVMLLTATLAGVEEVMRLGVTRPLSCLDQVLRSFLAQSCPHPRRLSITCGLLAWLMAQYGVLLTSIYIAYLQMLYAHTPTEPEIRSYEDMRHSQRNILLVDQELSVIIGRDFWRASEDLYVVTNSITYFDEMRSALNTSYVYPVTGNLWTMFVQIQSVLRRPLFRISEHFVWRGLVLFAVPVEQNCIFKEAFDAFLGRVKNSGLLDYWIKSSYYEMVQLGELPFYKVELPNNYRNMIWQDFRLIWLGYTLCCLISCLVFTSELIIARFRRDNLIEITTVRPKGKSFLFWS